jgi:hypothetical protein
LKQEINIGVKGGNQAAVHNINPMMRELPVTGNLVTNVCDRHCSGWTFAEGLMTQNLFLNVKPNLSVTKSLQFQSSSGSALNRLKVSITKGKVVDRKVVVVGEYMHSGM